MQMKQGESVSASLRVRQVAAAYLPTAGAAQHHWQTSWADYREVAIK